MRPPRPSGQRKQGLQLSLRPRCAGLEPALPEAALALQPPTVQLALPPLSQGQPPLAALKAVNDGTNLPAGGNEVPEDAKPVPPGLGIGADGLHNAPETHAIGNGPEHHVVAGRIAHLR